MNGFCMRLHWNLRGLVRSVALFACLAAIGSPAQEARETQEALSQRLGTARQAMQTGHLAQARMELAALHRMEPENADVNLQLGLLLGQLGDATGATAAFRDTIRTRPDWPEAHLNLGLSLIADADGRRDWVSATTEFQKAADLRPNYYEAHRLLGSALLEQGKSDQAIAEFQRALEGQANAAEIHLDLGRALEASGKGAQAGQEYRKAIGLRPGYAEAEVALGRLISPQSPGEAIEHVRRGLAKNPDNATAQYALAKLLQRQGDAVEAQIAFREAADLSKRRQEAVRCTRLSNEGLDAAHHGDGTLAIRKLREAVEVRPDSATAHFNYGLVLADQGDFTKGQREITQAISLSPANARFYLVLGRMLKQTGEGAKARTAFARAWRLDPGNEGVSSEMKDNAKQMSAAAESEDRASPFGFGAESNTADTHFAFAAVLASRQDWVGAAGEWMRVVALQPDHVDARNNLGVSLVHAGKNDAAELEFRKSLQISPDSAGAHFGLAIVDLERGNKAEAVRELRRVVRVQPDYPGAQSLLDEISRSVK